MAVSYDLSGKTAVVTGGAKGIGRAIAERLAKSGARVWVWDMNPVDLKDMNSAQVDVTNPDQIAQAIDQIVNEQLRIDILVNNAG